ncbi:MAG: FAD-dependent oxidoreductase, partial [Actinomycetota bacterium]
MEPRTDLETDVCILGAGPHGLATAVHLREADPSLDVSTLDNRDRWLSAWDDQFAKAEIETLRSPIVHHPGPDPAALMRHVDRHGLSRSGLPYDLPTTEAFRSFCRTLVEHSGIRDPLPTPPHALRSDGRNVEVDLRDRTIRARHVVIATNPHRRSIPDWTWPLLGHRPSLVEFASDLDLRELDDLAGRRIAVIGGGMTAAHVACGAVSRGATVHVVTRRPLDVRSFDTDPGWLGPKYLRGYFAVADPSARIAMSRAARAGGSIPGI